MTTTYLLEVPDPSLGVEEWTVFPREEELLPQIRELASSAPLDYAFERRPRLRRIWRDVIVRQAARKVERSVLIVDVARDDHARPQACRGGDRSSDSRAHLVQVPREREDRRSGPENVGSSSMGVALHDGSWSVAILHPVGEGESAAHFGRVEEKIRNATAVDVLVLVGDISEDDAIGDVLTGPECGRLFEVRFTRGGKPEKPKNRVGVSLQDRQPESKDERIDLH